MHLVMRHSILWENHEISMTIMVLAARQPERMGPGSGRVVQVKRAVCVILLSFSPLIFRSCRGRAAAIPGTQTAVTPTTASQTPETSPAQWWSSGSKLDIQVCLDHKDCSSVKKKKKWSYPKRSGSLLCIKVTVQVLYGHLDLRF